MSDELVEVALIGKTIGFKGALKLHNRSDFLSQFKKGREFFLKDGKKLRIFEFNKNKSTIIFEDYFDESLASNLVNKTLYQSIEETRKYCKLQKDEFFYFDIIGLKVYQDSVLLGEITDILEVGSSYLFEIKTDSNLVEKGLNSEFFIPYIDNFIKEINLDKKTVLVKNGLEILENS